MAQSRISKAASIFTRIEGLIKTELIPHNERPLWYDIYKAFPPIRDPCYRSILGNDEKPDLPKKIFYKEDVLRSYYFKNIMPITIVTLSSNNLKPIWEEFIEEYNKLPSEGFTKEELVQQAIKKVNETGKFIRLKNSNETVKEDNDDDDETDNLNQNAEFKEKRALEKDLDNLLKSTIDNVIVNKK